MDSTGAAAMSGYERTAWQRLLADAAGRSTEETGRVGRWTQAASSRAKDAAGRARAGVVEHVPGADRAAVVLDAATQKALRGLHTTFVERGLNSVTPSAILDTFRAEGVQVGSYDDIRGLDLQLCDRSVPRRKEKYVAVAVAEGAATSLAVTGATVSATVSGGTTLGVALAAVVVDVTSVLVGMGRIVAMVAAHYGYDVREPEEQVFAAGVLSYSTAGNAAEKAASLSALSRLVQDMMRQATWNQLQQHQLVNVIEHVVTALGFKLTHKKLAQAVPVAGVVINGGLNARLVHTTFARAQDAYRLRFLTEKYALDPVSWAPAVVDDQPTGLPMVHELLAAQKGTDDSPTH